MYILLFDVRKGDKSLSVDLFAGQKGKRVTKTKIKE
jgi:hypothetical protein